jgi:hypothetical protein
MCYLLVQNTNKGAQSQEQLTLTILLMGVIHKIGEEKPLLRVYVWKGRE